MNLVINEKVLKFENDPKNIEMMLDAITCELNISGQELDYLIIDDIIVNDNYQNYIFENIGSVQEIIVKVNDLKSLVEETLKSTFDYINNVIEALEQVADEFYQSPQKETWVQLANLLEGIEWIMDTLVRIDGIKDLKNILSYPIWNEYVSAIKSLNEQIGQLEEAMLNQDNVLIGDLLLHEILPSFEKAKEKVLFLIPTEETSHVS